MSLDPRNPVFRSVDKVILLLALVVAALALYNTFQKESAVKQVVRAMQTALTDTAEYVGSLPVPKDQPMLAGYDDLKQRFEPLDILGYPFRKFVFYSPKDVILPKLAIQYISNAKTQATVEYDAIKASTLQGLTMDMMALTVTDKAIVDVTVDKDKNLLRITPKTEGACIVRLVGIEGSRIELPLEITPNEITIPNVPEVPENFAATANRGYNTLTWKTHPKSVPAQSYEIFRSSQKGADPVRVVEVQVEGREQPSKEALAAVMAKAAAGGVDPERLCSPTIIEYSWDDLDVKPGVEYYYYIQTVCSVRDSAVRKESVQKTDINASPVVSVKAASPFVVSLVGGFGDTARIEVARWFGYIPRFKFFNVHCGEMIGDREYATGLMLVDFGDRVNEETRQMFVPNQGVRDVAVLVTTQRMVVADAQNNAQESLKDRGIRYSYEKGVDQFIRDCSKDPAPLQPPKFLPDKGQPPIRGSSVITVVNEASTKLRLGMRSPREKLTLEVPPFSRRTFTIEPGQFEMAATFAPDNPDDSPIVVYDQNKHDLKDSQTYQILFELKRAAAAPVGPK